MKAYGIILLILMLLPLSQAQLTEVCGSNNGLTVPASPFYFSYTSGSVSHYCPIQVLIHNPVGGQTYYQNTLVLNVSVITSCTNIFCYYRTYGTWNPLNCSNGSIDRLVTFSSGTVTLTVLSNDTYNNYGFNQTTFYVYKNIEGLFYDDLIVALLFMSGILLFMIMYDKRRKKKRKDEKVFSTMFLSRMWQ
jgi:hypothetical protein